MLLKSPGLYFLYSGEIFATDRPVEVSTVLGSCVSVCLWDPVCGAGGINHFVSPVEEGADDPLSNRYGEPAIKNLLKRMEDLGSLRRDIRCSVFGGGRVMDLHYDIGADNIKVARQELLAEGIRVMKWDVGGSHGRRLVFKTHTGVARAYKVRSITEYFNEDGSAKDPLYNFSMFPLTDID